nr:hypothetical protein [Tanacetum cinerariifolium]
MVTAALPCRKILNDKEKKKRKAEVKAVVDAPGADTQVEKVVRDKGAGKEGARKKRRVCVETPGQPVSEHVFSPTPLNHANPLETLTNEQYVSPNASVGHMGYSVGRFGNLPFTPQWGLTDSCCMDNSRLCRDMMSNLFTPTDNEFFNEGVRNESSIKRSWKLLSQSAQQQASTLLRIKALTEEHANLVYTHKSCKDDILEELEEEKKETGQLNYAHADRIKHLEEALRQSEAYAHQLRLDKESLAIGKGFIDRISIGRKNPNVQAILKATPNVNPASADIFIETYEKIFDKRYPYIDKVARMYLLDPSGLQNVIPYETGPTPGEGPRDTPTASFA